MARPNFYNDNRNRAFPFQSGTAGVSTPGTGTVTMLQLPDDFIVDCGFVMGPESGFNAAEHSVFLYEIRRPTAGTVIFEFRCDAPAVLPAPLLFSRDITATDYTTQFLESDVPEYIPLSQSGSISASESTNSTECGEPFWSGYLVTGSMSSVTSRVSTGSAITRAGSDAVTEPALTQNLDQSQVVSLNVANNDRTRAVRPADCPENEWPFQTGSNYTEKECIQGDIRIVAGYNNLVRQNNRSNVISISAVIAAGTGEPCEELSIFPTETPPIGAPNNLLAGDYYCNEVLRQINGVAGPNFNFIAGQGVNILPNQGSSRVCIDVDLSALANCTYSTSSQSS